MYQSSTYTQATYHMYSHYKANHRNGLSVRLINRGAHPQILEEQKKIIELVEEKLASIERLETEVDIQLIKSEKKQSILVSAFSGTLIEK
ncbi:MAG: hypothetical protein ACI9D5_000005 [Candidatus Endobugula sp.]|jgi:hypothetical protein